MRFLTILVWTGNLQAADFTARTYTAPDGKIVPYGIIVPPNYDKTKTYPAALFFHGTEQQGTSILARQDTGAV